MTTKVRFPSFYMMHEYHANNVLVEVISLVKEILPLVALFQVFDGNSAVSAGVLRARGKQFTGAMLNLTYVSFPLALFPASSAHHCPDRTMLLVSPLASGSPSAGTKASTACGTASQSRLSTALALVLGCA